MKLNFKKTGEGHPLIILHGLFGSAENWMTLAKELSKHYTLYLIDQRNHGDSGHDDEWDYKVMVEDLKDFMDENGLDSTYMMGHSMGGKTAMNFALTYPDKVDKLIVADISPRYYPIHHRSILEGLNSIDVDNLSSRNEAEKTLTKYIPERGIRQFLLKSLTRKDGKFVWKVNLPVITEKIENVGEGIDYDQAFEKPTLFMAGENSDYIQEKDKQDIERYFPKNHLITIKDAGHWLHAEQPAAVIETVKSFLG